MCGSLSGTGATLLLVPDPSWLTELAEADRAGGPAQQSDEVIGGVPYLPNLLSLVSQSQPRQEKQQVQIADKQTVLR